MDEHRVLARELGRTCVLKDIQAVQDARVDGIIMVEPWYVPGPCGSSFMHSARFLASGLVG